MESVTVLERLKLFYCLAFAECLKLLHFSSQEINS